MEKTEFTADFAALISDYYEKRATWVSAFGFDAGFDAWFISRVVE